jgi:hypothetical protein
MTRMEVSLSFVLPLTLEFLAGNQLEQSEIILMPSLEVSQKMMYECTLHMQ